MTVHAPEFIRPAPDGSIPPWQVTDFHLDKNPNFPFAILYDVVSGSQTVVTYEQLARAVHHVAHILSPNGAIPQGTSIGILVSTNTLTYVALVLGAMRAGLVPFPISPRTPVAGIAHLCTESRTSYILVGGSPAIAQLANGLQSYIPELDFVEIPSWEDLFPCLSQVVPNTAKHFKRFSRLNAAKGDSIIAILHSSGSTGMPRPIPMHQNGIFKNVINQTTLSMYAKPNTKVGTMALPTFHVLGLLVQYLTPLFIGYTQVFFAPKSSHAHMPVVPTAQLTIQAVAETGCEFLVTVPAFLETWSQDEAAISELKKLACVTFSGATLAEHIGKALADQGVRLHSGYGATELGYVVAPYDALYQDPHDWAYIRLSERVEVLFEPQHDVEDSHELIFLAGDIHEPFVINSNIGDQKGYRTKDLVVRHPSKPDLWRVVGRLDDQIVLLNGEKTNPIPMESEILRCPLIQYAAMFGRERNQTGVLVELVEDAKHKAQTQEGRTEIVDQIWPYIEKANLASFTHSRLARNAIVFTDPTRILPRTPKGTVSRLSALSAYAQDIEEMYATLDNSTTLGSTTYLPESWTNTHEVRRWVGDYVKEVLGRDTASNADLFQQGMDRLALSASILLRTIRGALRSSKNPTVRGMEEKLGQQTIFSHPTIEQLVDLFVLLYTGEQILLPSTVDLVQDLILKYGPTPAGLKTLPAMRRDIERESVLVTGTTGGLGSHLLAALLKCEQVERVWAVNRKSADGILARQKKAFEDKMLDTGLLSSPKLIMLEAEVENERLGLDESIYNEIQSCVTAIIHNAWQVNFNLSLQSFEPQIQGTRNLLDMALNSSIHPRFLFISSVSVAGFGKAVQLREEYLGTENALGGIGYGQSKLVAEKLLESAREIGLETCVVRLGQLTGDEKSGAWSTTDWVPCMIASSATVGCLPTTTGRVSWLPLDVAARSIVDVSSARDALLPPVIHCSHPRAVEWSHIINLFADALVSRIEDSRAFPVVPFQEWNERVRNAALAFQGSESDRHKQFPSTKVQSTFDAISSIGVALESDKKDADIEAGGTARLDISKAEELSESLKKAPRLGREHVKSWIGYWEKRGLFG
ncbi:acetyl-CoA synthetase-like protein [Ceratobasidium sp. AG-I]|nr:acetyl-CoA synthetase-like protein [Ceratobasidium sp. AG-I]